VTEPKLQEIDCDLISKLRRYITLRDLQLRVFAITRQLEKAPPKGKLGSWPMEWPYINWPHKKL
jgi:hypothetical protein